MKFDFCTNAVFAHEGEIFVAQMGEMGFEKYEELPGYKVVRANPDTGQIVDFLVNPTRESITEAPIRPIDAKFSRDGNALYIVDFGILGSHRAGTKPQPNSCSLWRIVKT